MPPDRRARLKIAAIPAEYTPNPSQRRPIHVLDSRHP
jgi:hypothetical protein